MSKSSSSLSDLVTDRFERISDVLRAEDIAAFTAGVDRIGNLLGSTLGPNARAVLFPSKSGKLSDDAAVIVREIELGEGAENAGGQLIKEVVRNTTERVGDGSTTAALLAQSIIVAGLGKLRSQKLDLSAVGRACALAYESIAGLARPVNRAQHIVGVAAGATNDDELADLVAKVFIETGGGTRFTLQPGSCSRIVGAASGEMKVELGAESEEEFQHKERRFRKGFLAVSDAVEYGAVPGGGSALAHAARELGAIYPNEKSAEYDIVREALSVPLHRIATNAKVDGDMIVRFVGSSAPTVGFDAKSRTVKDMFSGGVLEPLSVTRGALIRAVEDGGLPALYQFATAEPDDSGGRRTWGGVGGSVPPDDGDGGDGGSSGDEDGGGGRAGVPERHINAWLSDHDGFSPLAPAEAYELNLNVGKRVAPTLLNASDSAVDEADVGPDGLSTHWVLTGRGATLAATTPATSVTTRKEAGALISNAIFDLLIPAEGETEIVQVWLTTLAVQAVDIEVQIFVGATLYRRFEIRLEVNARPQTWAAASKDPVEKPSLVRNDHAFRRLGETQSVPPSARWSAPPGKLTISISGGLATLVGSINEEQLLGDRPEPWQAAAGTLDQPIRRVRATLNALREGWQGYLDDVEPGDLETRLSGWSREDGAGSGSTKVGKGHLAAWERVASSEALRELAIAGRLLYDELFPRGTIRRRCVDNAPPGHQFSITWTADNVANVPWELMFVDDVRGDDAPIDPTAFFALRFRLEYTPYRVTQEATVVGPSKRLGSLATDHRAHLLYWGADGPIAEEARWQRDQPWQPPRTVTFLQGDDRKRELKQLLDRPSPTTVYYMYCESNLDSGAGWALRFAETNYPEDTLKPADMGTEPFKSAPLVFVNACGTGAGSGFVADELERYFFTTKGVRGYLGTHERVPVAFASRFAVVFLRSLYHQLDGPVSAGEAAWQTRRFFWREYRNIGGLFYTYVNLYDLTLAETAVAVPAG